MATKAIYNAATGNVSVVEVTADEIAALQPSVGEHRTRRSNEFTLTAQIAIENGFVSNALGAPHAYSSDTDDQINLISDLQTAQITGSVEVSCTDAATSTKAFRVHTSAQMTQVFTDCMTAKRNARKRNRELQDQLAAATTIGAVDALTW